MRVHNITETCSLTVGKSSNSISLIAIDLSNIAMTLHLVVEQGRNVNRLRFLVEVARFAASAAKPP